MEAGACFRPRLLGQKIHHIKLLEGGKHRDDDRRRNDWGDGWNGNIPRPFQPGGAVQNRAFKIAPVDALHGAVHNHNHKRERKP